MGFNLLKHILRKNHFARRKFRRVASAESRLNRPANWDLPSKQEKVPAAKRATLGQDNPVKRFLDGVSDAYTSKIDRSAIWTMCWRHNLQYPIPVSAPNPRVSLLPEERRRG